VRYCICVGSRTIWDHYDRASIRAFFFLIAPLCSMLDHDDLASFFGPTEGDTGRSHLFFPPEFRTESIHLRSQKIRIIYLSLNQSESKTFFSSLFFPRSSKRLRETTASSLLICSPMILIASEVPNKSYDRIKE